MSETFVRALDLLACARHVHTAVLLATMRDTCQGEDWDGQESVWAATRRGEPHVEAGHLTPEVQAGLDPPPVGVVSVDAPPADLQDTLARWAPVLAAATRDLTTVPLENGVALVRTTREATSSILTDLASTQLAELATVVTPAWPAWALVDKVEVGDAGTQLVLTDWLDEVGASLPSPVERTYLPRRLRGQQVLWVPDVNYLRHNYSNTPSPSHWAALEWGSLVRMAQRRLWAAQDDWRAA